MATDNDRNARFRIAKFEINDTKVSVYLLNPGECFEGFGGSKHALPVSKTASLIIRVNSPWDMKDTEYELRGGDNNVTWDWIFNTYMHAVALQAKQEVGA